MEPYQIKTATAAAMCGCSRTAFNKWMASDAKLAAASTVDTYIDGRFVVKWFMANKRASFYTGDAATADINTYKTQYVDAKATRLEFEVGIQKANKVNAEDSVNYFENLVVRFRQDLLALARTLPGILYGAAPEESEELLEKYLTGIYTDISKDLRESAFKRYIKRTQKSADESDDD
jgi:hypothetical protein